MKKNYFFAAAAILLMAVSCGPITYNSADNMNLRTIDEFAFIEPVADILYYDHRNRPAYDYDLSDDAADLIESIIMSQRYPFSDPIYMDYDREGRSTRKWIQNLGDISTGRLDRVRVPNDLRRAIEDSGHRYGVVIYTSGYIRSREAIRYEERQEAIGDAIGAFIDALSKKNKDDDKKKSSSTTTYHSTENKTPYDSRLYCVVIDAERDEIIHYIHPLPFFEKDPLDGRDVEQMLSRLLRDFM